MSPKSIPLAHCILAVRDIGECLADLAEVIQQGINETNAINRGNVAAGLERAAYRIRYGTSEGFELSTARPPVKKTQAETNDDWKLEVKRREEAGENTTIIPPHKPFEGQTVAIMADSINGEHKPIIPAHLSDWQQPEGPTQDNPANIIDNATGERLA